MVEQQLVTPLSMSEITEGKYRFSMVKSGVRYYLGFSGHQQTDIRDEGGLSYFLSAGSEKSYLNACWHVKNDKPIETETNQSCILEYIKTGEEIMQAASRSYRWFMAAHRWYDFDLINNDSTRTIIHCQQHKGGIWKFKPAYADDTKKQMQVVFELDEYGEHFDQSQADWVLDLIDGPPDKIAGDHYQVKDNYNNIRHGTNSLFVELRRKTQAEKDGTKKLPTWDMEHFLED